MKEIFKPIKGFETKYEVSNLGRVRSLDRKDARGWNIKGRDLKIYINKKGYSIVSLYKNSQLFTCKVHRLVAQAFLPNPKNKPEVDHIDTDRSNNRVDNLVWVSRVENNNNPLTRQHNSASGKGRVFSPSHRLKLAEANRRRANAKRDKSCSIERSKS